MAKAKVIYNLKEGKELSAEELNEIWLENYIDGKEIKLSIIVKVGRRKKIKKVSISSLYAEDAWGENHYFGSIKYKNQKIYLPLTPDKMREAIRDQREMEKQVVN